MRYYSYRLTYLSYRNHCVKEMTKAHYLWSDKELRIIFIVENLANFRVSASTKNRAKAIGHLKAYHTAALKL